MAEFRDVCLRSSGGLKLCRSDSKDAESHRGQRMEAIVSNQGSTLTYIFMPVSGLHG